MARFSATILIALFLCAQLCAENLVYIFDSTTNNNHLAILKGANDALKDFNLRYGKNFKAVDFSLANKTKAPQDEILKLSAENEENIGAVVLPTEGDTSKLEAQIILLAAKKFPTVIIENELKQEGSLQTLSSDSESLIKNISAELTRKKNRVKFQIFAVVRGENEGYIEEQKALDSLAGARRKIAEALLEIAPVKFVSSDHFSKFQEKHRAELLALDNYAIVFLSELPLNDLTPLMDDGDRLSTVTFGGSPYMAQYLKSKQADLVAMPDYYGFGYLSAVALVEKYMQNKTPSARHRKLAPSFFTPLNQGEFNRLWLNLN